MNSFKNTFDQIMSKSITSLIDVLFSLSHIKNLGKGTKINAPEDFTPVLRFVVCSDIHLNGEEQQEAAIRFGQLFEDIYAFSQKCDAYKRLDAVVVAGDFTGGGGEAEYKMFNAVVEKHIKDETKLLCVLGNHEFINYRDYNASIGYDIYKKYISEEVDTHVVINGYHFIGVSYDNDGKKFKGKLLWLREQLDNATKENPLRPVFVYQHPHPLATVYGSINWGDTDLRKVLSQYPQVVDFSGHSHYAPSDPRSVWQGSFTAVGCGSLSAFMGNLNYIDGDKDAPGKSGGFWLVEVDNAGNIKMRLYDIENRTFFSDIEYYFENLADDKKRTYTWSKQKSLDTKPSFPKNAVIRAEKDNDGNIILKFPSASGFYPAENYKVTVSSEKIGVAVADTFISDYVRASVNGENINIGTLKSGEYKVKIIAYSPYAKRGENLKGTITVK
ncbi:MAG: metallophosphoesterase [Clostridia bacterium]|nr:metallophosphoesterase [Clostridia bacterium]